MLHNARITIPLTLRDKKRLPYLPPSHEGILLLTSPDESLEWTEITGKLNLPAEEVKNGLVTFEVHHFSKCVCLWYNYITKVV